MKFYEYFKIQIDADYMFIDGIKAISLRYSYAQKEYKMLIRKILVPIGSKTAVFTISHIFL